MMKKFLSTLLVVAAGTLAAPLAQAATLASYTYDYGLGKRDPQGNDVLKSHYVRVSDRSTSRFEDSFDFSALAYDSIDSVSLSLSFRNAGPRLFAEHWTLRVPGGGAGSMVDDRFDTLWTFASPQSFTFSAATDLATGTDAFAHSLATREFRFGFSEWTLGRDVFNLHSATLTINGTPSAVPLPAGGLLLLGGLMAVAGLRRRRNIA